MSWKPYKLGELLERKRVKVNIQSGQDYKLVTIRLWHQGVVLREAKKGEEIKSNMYKVSEGDFVLSGIDARNGAFGIVPKELEGAVVTNDFWCLEPKAHILRKDFFLFLTSTKFFDYICNQCSDGTTQRIRLQKDKFYNFEISLPAIEEQEDLVDALVKSKKSNEDISGELTHQLDLVKQLRQAFLREAMQGKLVSQDERDEPASVLLEKIKAEKERLVKEGKIKKQKPLPPITKEEIPFEIPEGWEWCRLVNLTSLLGDGLHGTPSYTKDGEYFFVNGNNLVDGGIVFKDNTKRVNKEEFLKYKKDLGLNSVLVSINGTLGNVAVYNGEKIILGKSACFFNLLNGINKWFIKRFVDSQYFLDYAVFVARQTTIKNVSLESMRQMLIPLPPLSEQQRIVAKLDELMGYCDELEASVKESQQQNELLLQQVLREALEPKTNA